MLEQAIGIDQINTAMTQMDSATQQNAALVEEAASASKAMEHQAQELVNLVKFFRLRGERAHQGILSRPQAAANVVSIGRKPAAAAQSKQERKFMAMGQANRAVGGSEF